MRKLPALVPTPSITNVGRLKDWPLVDAVETDAADGVNITILAFFRPLKYFVLNVVLW